MKRLTKRYSNGTATLDAAQFPPILQETIDREIRAFEPFGAAVERLAELEDKQTPQLPNDIYKEKLPFSKHGFIICGYCTVCENGVYGYMNYCPNCGQTLDWSDTNGE